MTTSANEIAQLIRKVEAMGATVTTELDMDALVGEGRAVISAVQITGLKGCGPFPMSIVAAAERMRELTAN
jgi:hypothetical protein